MKYINNEQPVSKPAPRVGILLTNLGTPAAPEKKAVRAYLKEFLSDPRVIEVPRLIWWFVLNVGILNIRPARSAAAYRKVWMDEGSPLMVYTKAQADALREKMAATHGDKVQVEFAMRYGSPSISDTMQRMIDDGVDRLLVLPLYPQYSGPTTGSTFDAVAQDFTRRRLLPQLRFVDQYHAHPAYIEALADSILEFRKKHGAADKLIFSYHGLPQSYLDDGDPYYRHCLGTTQRVVAALGLEEKEYMVTFQSRVGRAEWVRPYTDETLKALPGEGVKTVHIIAPGFAADCLETLEEIEEENRDYFMAAGGEQYDYIPCLNSSAAHINCLQQIVSEQTAGWLQD